MSDSAMPFFPSLTGSICADLRELANPAGAGRLSPHQLLQAVEALQAAQMGAQAAARQAARPEALDYLALEQAFASALAILDAVHTVR